MALTPNFSLIYYDSTVNKYVSSSVERRNWLFLDWQLFGIAQLAGNGIVSGWELSAGTGQTINISAGSGLIGGLLGFTSAADVVTVNTGTNYIYVVAGDDIAASGEVSFAVESIQSLSSDRLLLGVVVASSTAITNVDTSGAIGVGWSEALQYYLESHEHDGNPIGFIDLSSHVSGLLSSSNIGSVPASKITGLLDPANIPQLSHTELTGIGSYTHDQLDTFADTITDSRYKKFGDVIAHIVSQGMISHAHLYYENSDPSGYFRFIPNLAIVIPGITVLETGNDTPNKADLLDSTKTTALTDYVNHLFYTGLATALATPINFSQNWDSAVDWENAYYSNQVATNSDGALELEVLSSTTVYPSSGTMVLRYDTGRISNWGIIEWAIQSNDITSPISVRTRTAGTAAGLSTATWSSAITESGTTISSASNRWIEIEVTLQTDDLAKTPTLYDITIGYESASGGCGRALWPTFEAWGDGTASNVVTGAETVTLATGGTGTYGSSGTAMSSIIDGGSSWSSWVSILWSETVLSGVTTLNLYVRSDPDSTDILSKAWQGPYTVGSSGVLLSGLTTPGRYLQLRLVMGSSDSGETPIFDEATITYQQV